MSDEETQPQQTEHHGKDAADKPEDGAKLTDNPEPGQGTGEGEGGLGTQTGAGGGAKPVEPEDTESSRNLSR